MLLPLAPTSSTSAKGPQIATIGADANAAAAPAEGLTQSVATTQQQPEAAATPGRGGEEEYGPFELCLEHVNRGNCARTGCLKQHVDLSVWGHPDLAADYAVGAEAGVQRLCPLYFLTGYCRLYGSRVPLLMPDNTMIFLNVKAQGRRMKDTRCLFRHDVDPVYAYPPTFCKRRLPVHVEQLREWWFRERLSELGAMWLAVAPAIAPNVATTDATTEPEGRTVEPTTSIPSASAEGGGAMAASNAVAALEPQPQSELMSILSLINSIPTQSSSGEAVAGALPLDAGLVAPA